MATRVWTGAAGDGDYGSSDNWSTPGTTPTDTDDVFIPAGTPAITTGLGATASTLATFTVEEGYTGAIGSSSAYLQIRTLRLTFRGQGQSYIDLSGSTPFVDVYNTAVAAQGKVGLYLLSTGQTDEMNVMGGTVGVAWKAGETSKLTAVRCTGGSLRLGAGAGPLLNDYYQLGGSHQMHCSSCDIYVWGGSLLITGTSTHSNIQVMDGQVDVQTPGNITVLDAHGGNTTFLNYGNPGAIGTLTVHTGGSVSYDPRTATVTSLLASTGPLTITVDRA